MPWCTCRISIRPWPAPLPVTSRAGALHGGLRSGRGKGSASCQHAGQFQTAMEFDRFYPLLGDLTPESVVASSLEELASSRISLPFPVFVKGAIKSNKDKGWAACVANSEGELEAIAKDLLARERSRGRIIIRRFVKFRTLATDRQGFPIGREYRIFLHRDRVLALAFYWDEHRDSAPLSNVERSAIETLSMEASRRVGTPYIAVDVGQLEDGHWIVIEVSDGQFAGLGQVGPHPPISTPPPLPPPPPPPPFPPLPPLPSFLSLSFGTSSRK